MPSKRTETKVERSLRSLNNTLLERLRAAEAKVASAQAAAADAEQRLLVLQKAATTPTSPNYSAVTASPKCDSSPLSAVSSSIREDSPLSTTVADSKSPAERAACCQWLQDALNLLVRPFVKPQVTEESLPLLS